MPCGGLWHEKPVLVSAGASVQRRSLCSSSSFWSLMWLRWVLEMCDSASKAPVSMVVSKEMGKKKKKEEIKQGCWWMDVPCLPGAADPGCAGNRANLPFFSQRSSSPPAHIQPHECIQPWCVTFTETRQIWDVTLWMGSREPGSAHSTASPFALARDEMRSKQQRREKKVHLSLSC